MGELFAALTMPARHVKDIGRDPVPDHCDGWKGPGDRRVLLLVFVVPTPKP